MNIIQENLLRYISNPNEKIVSDGKFTAKDFIDLTKIITGTDEDFLIFDNGGGKKFDIIFDREFFNENNKLIKYPVKDFIEAMLVNEKRYVYSFQLNKQQTILKNL